MKTLGALDLSDFAYIIQEYRNGTTLYVPNEHVDDSGYWSENYDFTEETENSVRVVVFESKTISQVDDDSYNGDKNVYLLKIDGKMYIFDDNYDSWGGCNNPTLEEVFPETKTVYQSKSHPENAFIITL